MPARRAPVREALEDEWLVVRAQLGEREAFDALVRRWHPPLWQYARRLTGRDEAAADAVQDVWMRVLRGLGRLREAARFRPWLFGIARRVLMDRLREKYRDAGVVAIETVDEGGLPPADEGSDPAEDLDRVELTGRLHDALAALPVVEREVIVLFYLRELPVGELAEVIGVPPGTVKSRLFRARRELRRLMEGAVSS
ncbi:MAG: sigma-70 family RNA polymerase sigma factor [Vicinamibacterales bacterium]